MSITIGCIILAELLVSGFIVWGFMHEELFIRFENRLLSKYARRPYRVKRAAKRMRVIVGRTHETGPDYTAA